MTLRMEARQFLFYHNLIYFILQLRDLVLVLLQKFESQVLCSIETIPVLFPADETDKIDSGNAEKYTSSQVYFS